MKTVVFATLLMISASLVGCLSEDDEETEQPELYGEIFWNQDGQGTIYQNNTGFTVRTLTENCEWGGEKIDGYCTIELSENINDMPMEIEIKGNGEFYDYCLYFDSQSFCAELHLIDGGLVTILSKDWGYDEKECQVSSNTIGAPPADYDQGPEWGYLDDSASDWHSKFEEFVKESEDAARELGCESITYYPTYQYVIDNEYSDICGIIWPDDPFKAAIYSFVAEYDLAYGGSVGCYEDEYDDLTYSEVALDLENNWDRSITALEYAQKWVDDYSEDYEMQPFNLTSEFNISEGGLGWLDSSQNNQTIDCDETQEKTDAEENYSSFFEIETNPNPESHGMKCFTKYVGVFGLGVYAESGLSDAQILHAAAVLAELLDNDEDGVADDEALLSRLQNMSAIVPMFNSEDPDDSPALEDFMNNYNGEGVSAVLFADEVDPSQPGHWGSDATVEEIMHTINHIGHVYVYPDAFGLEPNSSLLSDAMDEARGGQFRSHPDNYPENAWYHYDDTTCDYECMAIEYIYWAQVSNMEILNDTVTCDGIANEWEPCSKDLLESMDVLIYALITDPQYHLPQNAPDGEYNPQSAED